MIILRHMLDEEVQYITEYTIHSTNSGSNIRYMNERRCVSTLTNASPRYGDKTVTCWTAMKTKNMHEGSGGRGANALQNILQQEVGYHFMVFTGSVVR